MPNLDALLAWLTELRPAALLSTMSLLAAVENIFPPIPADVLVAFGGFISARAGRSPIPAFLAIWGGNVVGAMFTYWLGRRFGGDWTERRLHLGNGAAHCKVMGLYARFGVAAFFVSSFLPGVRSLVPPRAGSLKIPPLPLLGPIPPASSL